MPDPRILESNLDEIVEKINEVAKFKTHKQRKAFGGEIKQMIRDMLADAFLSPPGSNRMSDIVTKPMPDKKEKPAGYAFMDGAKSALGDDIR